ncbi:MAG: hypothetical protein OXE74_02570 [Cyanobacteria bacterium MAG CAR2_bin_4]|nr:hypothetical protein [Cyanobacteria bacterium MAG CAR2_bin_4]
MVREHGSPRVSRGYSRGSASQPLAGLDDCGRKTGIYCAAITKPADCHKGGQQRQLGNRVGWQT